MPVVTSAACPTPAAGRTHRYWRGEEALLFPFGFGLSYTSFQIGNVSVESGAGGASARLTVTNAGGMTADTSVLLLLSYLGPQPPSSASADVGRLPSTTVSASGCASGATSTDLVQRLAGWRRTGDLAPGASTALTFALPLVSLPGEGWGASSWAGFGDPEPPCGAYALRFGTDQPTAAIVLLA